MKRSVEGNTMLDGGFTFVRSVAVCTCLAVCERHALMIFALETLSDKRVHCRQSIQERRIIFVVEWQLGQSDFQQRSDSIRLTSSPVMLLGGLAEASVIDTAVLLQLVCLFGDVVEL